MKWLYICLGIIGLLAPIGVLYAVNYDRRIPGAIIDLGLLFFSTGIGIIFIPIGVGLGLALAAVIQIVWKKVSAGTSPARSWLHPQPPSTERPQVPSEPEDG